MIIVAKVAQTKIGIFINDMPGHLIFKMVTKKFIPEIKVPAPEIWTLQSQ
jgi:hypothetical protein